MRPRGGWNGQGSGCGPADLPTGTLPASPCWKSSASRWTRRTRMAKDHGPGIKDDERYEALRRQGASKEKAARIANTDPHKAGKRGGSAPRYDEWSRDRSEERRLGKECVSKLRAWWPP